MSGTRLETRNQRPTPFHLLKDKRCCVINTIHNIKRKEQASKAENCIWYL